MNYNNVPAELKNCKQWICHSNKVPKSPLYNGNANTTDPKTWGSFDQAVSAVSKYGYSGIGFVFGAESPYCGIDIDHCINPDTGELNENAEDITRIMNSYTEISPSRTGLHIIYKGELHRDWKKKLNNALGEGIHLEMYQTERYFTVTGNIYSDEYMSIAQADSQAQAVYNAYGNAHTSPVHSKRSERNNTCISGSDYEITKLAEKNNTKFGRLYSGDISEYGGDHSRADMALCSILAFYTRDIGQIDRIFRNSGLMREKWDRKTGSSTYGMITINNALETVTEQYNPDYYRRKAHNDFSDSDKCIVGQMTSCSERSNCSPTAEALRYTEEYSSQSIVADDFKICSIPDFGFDDFRYKQLSPIETARFFAECIGKYAAYIPELRDWKIYDGIKWIDDSEGLRVMSRAKEFAEKILKAIPKPTDPEQLKIQRLRDKGLTEEEIDAMPLNERNEAAGISDTEIESISKENLFINSAYKYYSYFEKRQGRKSLVDDTKDILRKSIEDFDGKPYLFNLRNGTYNLEASCLQPHNPADLLTASAAVSYDPNAKSERFIKFIDDITGGNKEKANYIQKALGYSLKGIKNEECFFLLYGATTRNGKGTLLETMLSVFGDYGKNMDFSTLSKNKNQDGGRATPDLARLKGVRLVKVDEPDRGVFFDEGLIKKLSGGDKITARHLYGNLFEFIPEFSIFITANNKPNVSDTSIFQSDRLKLISFDRHFSENERDTGLKEKLREEHELSGIFNWLLNGYFLYCNCGLKNTSEMNTLLAGYAKDSDEIQQYIDDRLLLDMTLDNKQIESVKSIRNDYTIWCRHLGTHPLSTRTFKEELRKHGVMFKVSHNQDYICGKLKTPFPD